MSKKNKRRRQPTQSQASASPAQPPQASAPQAPMEQLEAAAVASGLTLPAGGAAATPDGVAVGSPDGEPVLRSRLQLLIDAYARGKAACDERERKLLEHEQELNLLRAKLDQERRALDTERSAVETETRGVEAARAEASARLSAIVEREERVQEREADADAGFVARREEMLRELQRAHEELLERNQRLHEKAAEREQAHLERLSQQDAEHERKLETLRREAQANLQTRETALQEAEGAIRTREREVKRALFDAEEAVQDAEDLKAHVEEYIQERTAERVANVNRQMELARRDNEDLRSRIEALERTLVDRDAAVRILENLSPEAVKTRIETLQRRIGELENDLANRPSRSEAEELRTLRDERARWEQDRLALNAEKGRLESRLDRLMIEVDKVESLRDRNTALLETQRLLKAALDDLRSDIDERLEKHRDQPVFPEMIRMDEDVKLRRVPARLFPGGSEELDLREFAADLRHRIGLDANNVRPELYYREEDIRAFLAGLAMSRLHIIQGISGIGKSSLPRAFADAVGGFCETVSVQAGWRDRNDLFGYFNAFERRYYELPFAQALYRAAMPQWQDRIAIILLDEMNLSHPEQYAADVLDVLERQDLAERRFELLSFTPSGRTPAALADGRYLPLTRNVWFVGTANHDETTKDFADKTYDRSFVLELPGRPTRFPLTKQPRRAPVSYQALAEAFDRAASSHEKLAEKALTWMQQHLRGTMDDRFRVGWGGRLEGQVRRFVPVVLAAGGDLSEALDQVITTRVLRKIKGRHDNLEEDLEHLLDVLVQTWPDKSREPIAARQLIEDELRHLKG